MITLGPYEFSDTDAARTLGHHADLFDQLTDGLDDEFVAVAAPYRRDGEAAWADAGEGEAAQGEALGRLWGAWRSAMDALRAAGAFGPAAVGTATGLFLNDGGVAKQPVPSVRVGFGGVDGDRQDNRTHHGRPWQALCLWSSEVIDSLASDGHRIAPGRAGENITVTGLPWPRVRPGVHLRIGDVLAEISSYATPCAKNAAWFIDGDFNVMHERNGSVARIYATVIEPGSIALGDPALLEPDA